MENNQAAYNYLNIVPFQAVTNWSTSAILRNRRLYKPGFKLEKIGNLIRRSREKTSIKDNVLYKRVTIRLYNKGVVQRDEVLGKTIGTKNQYYVRADQFIMSKIDARNGAFGIVPSELEGAAITQDFLAFDIYRKKVLPAFFILLTYSDNFRNLCQKASSGTTGRQRIDEQAFLNFEVPIPDLIEQEKMVKVYQDKSELAIRQNNEAELIQNNIEMVLFELLGIKKVEKKTFEKGRIHLVRYKDVVEWGGNKTSKQLRPENMFSSGKFKNESILNYFNINPQTGIPRDVSISFIPMRFISDEFGVITEFETKPLSNGYTRFKENDILWARITPCMENGKSAIAKNLINGFGFGSTEYHVLRRKGESNYSIKLMHYLLRTRLIREIAIDYFTGSAGQRKVPKTFLENINIPLPPIKVQNEIVKALDEMNFRINKLKNDADANRKQAIEAFEKSIFITEE